MPPIEILATDDIPGSLLKEFIESLNEDEHLVEERSRLALCSGEPPSLVNLLIDAEWWIKAFGIYAAIFLGEIVKEAGKDAWRNKGEIPATIGKYGNKFISLIEKIQALREKLQKKTQCNIIIRLNAYSDYHGPRISLSFASTEDAILHLAIFTKHMSALLDFIRDNDIASRAATGIHLRINEDYSISMTWLEFNGNEFLPASETLPFIL
jgi:hypothetical protein